MPDKVSPALSEVRTVHSRADTATYALRRQINGLRSRMAKGDRWNRDDEPHTLEELEEILEALEQVVLITDRFAKNRNKVHRV